MSLVQIFWWDPVAVYSGFICKQNWKHYEEKYLGIGKKTKRKVQTASYSWDRHLLMKIKMSCRWFFVSGLNLIFEINFNLAKCHLYPVPKISRIMVFAHIHKCKGSVMSSLKNAPLLFVALSMYLKQIFLHLCNEKCICKTCHWH